MKQKANIYILSGAATLVAAALCLKNKKKPNQPATVVPSDSTTVNKGLRIVEQVNNPFKDYKPLYLNLNNTTSETKTVSLFNPQVYGGGTNDILGNQTKYSWDMTAQLAAAITNSFRDLVVVARTNTTGSNYTTYLYDNGTAYATIDQVLNAFNQLGLGTFYADGNTIFTYSNTYIFSSANLINAITSPTGMAPNSQNTQLGTVIYDVGYDNEGNGPNTQISTDNTFWTNNNPPAATGSERVMNLIGVKTFNGVGNYNWNIIASIYSDVAKTIYVGVSSSSSAGQPILYLNNEQIIAFANNQREYFHIYPINIEAGTNLFQLSMDGANNNFDGFALEIYDNTAAEIQAATQASDLNILFTTEGFTGIIF